MTQREADKRYAKKKRDALHRQLREDVEDRAKCAGKGTSAAVSGGVEGHQGRQRPVEQPSRENTLAPIDGSSVSSLGRQERRSESCQGYQAGVESGPLSTALELYHMRCWP